MSESDPFGITSATSRNITTVTHEIIKSQKCGKLVVYVALQNYVAGDNFVTFEKYRRWPA